ncbi:hypothetical protein [Streptomyces turgidiscabies]|uniref:hypothetical protein n=1 Tax=Streptomyces turgidiscabies TaxID=85558 RepID=UPI0038F6DF9F
MTHGTDQQPQQPTPRACTEPLPPAVTAAVAQYEAATLRYDDLAAKPQPLTAADVEAFLGAQSALHDAVAVLADHRRLDLTAPAETASRYRQAAAHYRDLAARADYEGCEYVRDEMTMCLCQLADAGRLDLIGAGA